MMRTNERYMTNIENDNEMKSVLDYSDPSVRAVNISKRSRVLPPVESYKNRHRRIYSKDVLKDPLLML